MPTNHMSTLWKLLETCKSMKKKDTHLKMETQLMRYILDWFSLNWKCVNLSVRLCNIVWIYCVWALYGNCWLSHTRICRLYLFILSCHCHAFRDTFRWWLVSCHQLFATSKVNQGLIFQIVDAVEILYFVT